jgi:hypothetical protein
MLWVHNYRIARIAHKLPILRIQIIELQFFQTKIEQSDLIGIFAKILDCLLQETASALPLPP